MREVNRETKIACVGAGLIGQSWAALFAAKGYSVILQDTDQAALLKGRQRCTTILSTLEKGNILSRRARVVAQRKLESTQDISKAVERADYVQESVFENYETKRTVFKAIDRYAPENCILASSTSSLLISRIQRFVKRKSTCIVAHPFNPVHLEPLVELVPGRWTSDETVSLTYELMKSIGKVPIIVAKELPGHVANRLTAAVWREAIDLLIRGVASADDIDKAVKYGPGLRWAVQGPFVTYHLGGGDGGIEYFLEQLTPGFEARWSSLASWKQLPRGARLKIIRSVKNMEAVKDASIDTLNDQRDRRLMELLRVDRCFHGKTKHTLRRIRSPSV